MAEVFEDVTQEKYDVGIFGLWYGENYGSQMTYFALNKVIQSMGYSVAMIRNPLGDPKFDFAKAPASHPYQFALRQNYNVTKMNRLSEMRQFNQQFDKFVIGSDQMWNYYLSRPYGQSYFLEFADDDKVKVAYATSFGHDSYDGPEEEKALTKKNLGRFSAVSVRDDFSKDILRRDFFRDAQEVIDPVFLCEKKEYEAILEGQEIDEIEDDFIFAYVLDPNGQMGEALVHVAEKTGLKVVVVSDLGRRNEKWWNPFRITSDRVVFVNDIKVESWLNCIKKAKMVLTDSFHGAAFSILFHKPFIVKKNEARGGKRFDCLLEMAGLKKQMVNTGRGMLNKFDLLGSDFQIDYDAVDARIAKEKERCYQWLSQALAPKKINANTINLKLEKSLCTGCSACMNACPVGAIAMRQDFLGYYRAEVDHAKCINCGKCAAVCPSLNVPKKENAADPEVYEFVAADSELLDRSSSGGVFSLLAKQVLEQGGCVAGVAWDSDLSAKHILIQSEQELDKIRKSKYVQSRVGDIFAEVKKNLLAGRQVLFSGCPCQVAGLKNYLEREYENLVLVDILCGYAPSVEFFRKYLEDEFPEGVAKYEFRCKDNGWNCVCFKTILEDGTEIVRQGQKRDYYQKAYHSHIMCPPHCEQCKFQAAPRFGDLTLGDFWGIEKHDSEIETTKGVSVVICNNEKGRQLLQNIPDAAVSVRKKVPKEWLGGNGYVFGGHNWVAPQRDDFYRAILEKPFKEAVMYAMKPNHGEYRPVYDTTNAPLQYDSRALHFYGESDIWEEVTVDGRTVYIMKKENVAPGHYLAISLAKCLQLDAAYRLRVRFRIKTKAKDLFFYLKESGSNSVQVIRKCNLEGKNDGKHWIDVDTTFRPDAFYYDEFMLGAKQVIGDFNFIEFDYVLIHAEGEQ